MTVTLQTVQLLQPHGELEYSFFPDKNLDTLLGPWLSQAITKVHADTTIKAANHNDAAKQWVYYLAYSFLARRYAAMPSSVSVNKGADSVSYSKDRPEYWANLAAKAKAAFEGYVVSVTPKDSRKSMPVRFEATW